MEVKKCDRCKEEKRLILFKNIVDSGFSAFCWECAVGWGKLSGTSKKQMIENEIRTNSDEQARLYIERLELIEMYIRTRISQDSGASNPTTLHIHTLN